MGKKKVKISKNDKNLSQNTMRKIVYKELEICNVK